MLERIIAGYTPAITDKLDIFKSKLFKYLPFTLKCFKLSKPYKMKLLKEKVRNLFIDYVIIKKKSNIFLNKNIFKNTYLFLFLSF